MFPFFLLEDRTSRRGPNVKKVEPVALWSEDSPSPKHGVKHIYSAASWNPYRIFGGVKPSAVNDKSDNNLIRSPSGDFSYREVILPRGEALDVRVGGKLGWASFDGDVVIPQVHEKGKLWMSYTPQEVMTCRIGVRHATGHVIIAGLGMGWMLSRVAQRKSVKKITIVERSKELCDWVLPHVNINGKDLSVVTDDANVEVPNIEADVALWDIWECLGHVNNDDVRRMHQMCKVKRTWFWGAGSYG
jgi:hypothetical protein